MRRLGQSRHAWVTQLTRIRRTGEAKMNIIRMRRETKHTVSQTDRLDTKTRDNQTWTHEILGEQHRHTLFISHLKPFAND